MSRAHEDDGGRYVFHDFIREVHDVCHALSAATGDKTLKPDDAADVLEELLEAQNRSRYIGLKLRVPQHVVDGTYSQPCDHLYSVIMEYLKKVEPRPTWKAIVDALKSPLVNFPNLAQKIERKYCLPASPQQGTYMYYMLTILLSHSV